MLCFQKMSVLRVETQQVEQCLTWNSILNGCILHHATDQISNIKPFPLPPFTKVAAIKQNAN